MGNNVELLAPAGSFEKLKLAIGYGADAVYFGGELFNLRARSKNFTIDKISNAMNYLHKRNKKGYLTLNIYPRNNDLNDIENYLKKIAQLNVDAIIVSTLGVLKLVKNILPDMEIHVSTQANITDIETADMWYKLGAKRAILARELSINEIKQFVDKSKIDTEIFIHGAMCMAYSGRCLLSKYMTGRDANRGDCAHPCRWKYYVREEKRKEELFEISEDESGLYIFNSKDLMLWDYIPSLMDIGIKSFKIEGRIKGILYLTTVIRSYRLLIDSILSKNNHKKRKKWRNMLFEANNRGYHEGFISGPDGYESNIKSSRTFSDYRILGYIDETGEFIAKAPFEPGEKYDYFEPGKKQGSIKVISIVDLDGKTVKKAKPGRTYKVTFDKSIKKFSVLRYKR